MNVICKTLSPLHPECFVPSLVEIGPVVNIPHKCFFFLSLVKGESQCYASMLLNIHKTSVRSNAGKALHREDYAVESILHYVQTTNYTFFRHSWPLSTEGSLACRTYCDMGHVFSNPLKHTLVAMEIRTPNHQYARQTLCLPAPPPQPNTCAFVESPLY